MNTFIGLFFLIGTSMIWVPMAILWGLLKSLFVLIVSIFQAFEGSATLAFGEGLSGIFNATAAIFSGIFEIIRNLWDWTGQNTTEAILLGIIGFYLGLGSYQNKDLYLKLFMGLVFSVCILGGIDLLVATIYLSGSALIAFWSNGYFFPALLASVAGYLGVKLLRFTSDKSIERSTNRSERVKNSSYEFMNLPPEKRLSRGKAFLLKLFEVILITVVISGVLLAVTLALMAGNKISGFF
jgi:hypothetical protein